MIIPVRSVGDVLFGPITMRLTQFTKLLWKMIGLSTACDEEMAVQQWSDLLEVRNPFFIVSTISDC